MDFLELASARRSIRKYSSRPVPRADLEKCVEAARFSPSACDSQPWKFIVVDDPAKKEKLAEAASSGPVGMNPFARDAAAFIAIVPEKMKLAAWSGQRIKGTDFRKIDIGIACAHIILQARELGIGTCIIGWFDRRKAGRCLSVPRGKKVELMISLGYPAPELEVPEKKLKDKSETVGINRY